MQFGKVVAIASDGWHADSIFIFSFKLKIVEEEHKLSFPSHSI
jgi:hypothetical protein